MNMKKGFTLVEIMIVVAIIAILAAVAIPNFISYRRTSQEKACEANKKTIENAVEAYLIKYPDTDPGTIAMSELVSKGFLKEEKKCPVDNKDYTPGFTNDGTTGAKVTVKCTGSHAADGSGSGSGS